ncbi:MAG: tripartite tricarboxylate transporter TctB family protein [Oscillospiraceae bacterium]|jgi:putative tricarboxylic transport membrane protein|nr:tripartite tricarboxylate transporter TctB family protein [Oscillospiraceae bacterium]
MKKMNLIFSGICAAIGVFLIVLAAGYPTAADYGTGVPGPGLWPIVISAVMLAMAALLVMKSVKMPAEKNVDVPMWNEGTKRVYITMGILFAYTLVLEFLGFIIATTIMEAIFIQWFAKKKPIITVLISVVVTLVIYCVFQFVLNVPVGSFGILAF